MGCGEVTARITKRLTCFGTQQQHMEFTDWFQCTGVDEVKAVIARASTVVSGGTTGAFETRLVIQVAPVRTDKPGAWATVGSDTYTGDGENCTGDESVSNATGANFWVRFGIGYKLTGDRTFGQADVSLIVSYGSCGMQVGGRTLQLQTTSSTEVRYGRSPASLWRCTPTRSLRPSSPAARPVCRRDACATAWQRQARTPRAGGRSSKPTTRRETSSVARGS